MWSRKYVEVGEGVLKFYSSRGERGPEAGVVVDLAEALVSMQNHRIIKIESKSGLPIRIFRASSEIRANKWLLALSRYSLVVPTGEGKRTNWCCF